MVIENDITLIFTSHSHTIATSARDKQITHIKKTIYLPLNFLVLHILNLNNVIVNAEIVVGFCD